MHLGHKTAFEESWVCVTLVIHSPTGQSKLLWQEQEEELGSQPLASDPVGAIQGHWDLILASSAPTLAFFSSPVRTLKKGHSFGSHQSAVGSRHISSIS